jgi:hypothetical protein
MTILQISNFLGAGEGIRTQRSFSPIDHRITYAREQDLSAPLASALLRFRKQNWNWWDFSKFAENTRAVRTITKLENPQDDNHYAVSQATDGNEELLKEWSDFGMQYLVHRHFSLVEIPQAGDLVVYYDENHRPVHAGVIQMDRGKPQVKSKWGGLLGGYVFQHDFFVVPYAFGTLVKVYRLNKDAIYEDPLPAKPENTLYIQVNDTFKFVSNPTNETIRCEIEKTRDAVDLVTKFPQIQALELAPTGQCTLYAISKTLPGYKKSLAHEMDLLGYGNSKILKLYYTQVNDPRPGDLSVYSTVLQKRVHMGIYLAPDLIESKWGQGRVYRHPCFYVDPGYGDNITFYRLKPGAQFTPSEIDSCSIQ